MKKRVLIIDDDKELCEELSDILREQGFDAFYAINPTKAKSLLELNPYDMLILDFKMPSVNGIELLKESKEKIKEMKVFIISGSLSVEKPLFENNLSSLVSRVFAKPLSIEALLEALKR